MDKLGHNDHEQVENFHAFFIPSWTEVLLAFTFSAVIVFIMNIGLLWQMLRDSTPTNVISLDAALETRYEFLSDFFANKIVGNVAVMFTWAIVGSVSYMAVWFIRNLIIRSMHDYEEASIVNGRQKNRILQTIFSDHALFGFSVLAFVIFTLMLLFGILPFSAVYASISLQDLTKYKDYTYLGIAILINMSAFYIYSRLWFVTKYSYRRLFSGIDS